jgi:hypothetical protein
VLANTPNGPSDVSLAFPWIRRGGARAEAGANHPLDLSLPLVSFSGSFSGSFAVRADPFAQRRRFKTKSRLVGGTPANALFVRIL